MTLHIHPTNFHSIPRQAKRLDERHADNSLEVDVCGMKIAVEPGVYQTSGDSELMIESVQITKEQNFLEVGCGTGVISIAVAQRSSGGVAVDINERAVANAQRNAIAHKIDNVKFAVLNVFENVTGLFDVIICNPPYTQHEVRDTIDRMFWDPQDEMKRAFFKNVGNHLRPTGKIYFGWADFADIDVNLPFKLAQENGYMLVNTFKKPHKNDFNFYVLEFARRTA